MKDMSDERCELIQDNQLLQSLLWSEYFCVGKPNVVCLLTFKARDLE